MDFCRTAVAAEPPLPGLAGLLDETERQLAEYFEGSRRTFNLPLAPDGTCFQRRVWHELRRIPYGETISYAEVARRVESCARAVGQANGCNPIAIVVPCHRVIEAGGRLGGYGGGLPAKRWLLEFEQATASAERSDLLFSAPTAEPVLRAAR